MVCAGAGVWTTVLSDLKLQAAVKLQIMIAITETYFMTSPPWARG